MSQALDQTRPSPFFEVDQDTKSQRISGENSTEQMHL
jgi:hypothetical protein